MKLRAKANDYSPILGTQDFPTVFRTMQDTTSRFNYSSLGTLEVTMITGCLTRGGHEILKKSLKSTLGKKNSII
jgi:hypothetical protein